MNTTATSYSSEHSWLAPSSRRNSVESILSIQGKETDFAQDTTDTEGFSDGDVEYEPATDEEQQHVIEDDSSESDEKEIISTKVIEVTLGDDGDLVFADSEQTDSDGSDSEIDWNDYWECAQCRASNNNPLYRYCEKCYKERKNFFPPRPKPKFKCRKTTDSNADSGLSQDLSQGPDWSQSTDDIDHVTSGNRKRRASTVERETKHSKTDLIDVIPAAKAMSDPSVTIDSKNDGNNKCIICCTEPKSGVFVHGRIAHICCCYRCAVKVWSKSKRCPLCNCKVSNVLKAVM